LYIEMLESEDAIYVALISKNLEMSIEDFYCDSSNGIDLFECQRNKILILTAIEKDKVGKVTIRLNGAEQELFFHAIPLYNVEYWVIIGVNRSLIVERLDADKLRIPIFIIGILFVISTMDSIWQRIIKIRKT